MLDSNLQRRLEITFASLNSKASDFPGPMALSTELKKAIGVISASGHNQIPVKPEVATLFTTAAIEMWQRSVHSFLISVSLTEASPIWTSVSGYYASHYAIRALAHLLGHFELHQDSYIVELELLANGTFACTFKEKRKRDEREHLFYWKMVQKDSSFAADPLLALGRDVNPDVKHRNRANYADHIAGFPPFKVLNEQAVKNRVQHISSIPFSASPIPDPEEIPDPDKFPDIGSVQIIAYHRLVRFRQLLDEIIGGSNRFWDVHRNPSWARGIIDFQLTEQDGLRSFRDK